MPKSAGLPGLGTRIMMSCFQRDRTIRPRTIRPRKIRPRSIRPTDNSPADNWPNGQFAHKYCFFVKIYGLTVKEYITLCADNFNKKKMILISRHSSH